jgi:phosphate transport system permease protein
MPAESAQTKVIPERFQVARGTLLLDQFMTALIWIGGIGVIISVFGIFFFIGVQIIPLFAKASAKAMADYPIPGETPRVLGVDEWVEVPFTYSGGSTVTFHDLRGDRGSFDLDLGLPPDVTISSVAYDAREQTLLLGTEDGRFAFANIQYSPTFEGEKRTVVPSIELEKFYQLGDQPGPVTELSYGKSAGRTVVAGVQQTGGTPQLWAVTLEQKRSLMGAGEISRGEAYNLTEQLPGEPRQILVGSGGADLIVSTEGGKIDYFHLENGQWSLRQEFTPFEDSANPDISQMGFLLGDVSLVISSAGGENRLYSLFLDEEQGKRLYGLTKEFPNLEGAADYFSRSLRNKAFLVGSGKTASLRYGTTENVRWEKELPFDPVKALIDPKYKHMLFLDEGNTLHVYKLDDPHPEAGFNAFFGKVHYEGGSEPEYKWQSTGGSDEFEPKFSLIPLILGSLKGTLWSLVFAVPIALLAAVYTANFCRPEVKRVIKPTMEIMASLPSVVLGFLAALWLAPLIETKVPSVILVLIALPLSAVIFGFIWSELPLKARSSVRPGWEAIIYLPFMLLIMFIAWKLGPAFERLAFVVENPQTGERVADFRLWWPQFTGAEYAQRNSLVVGFMMGFAVIPIIFTIAEDSLSNVPRSLTAASMALGASRWQTAAKVVLPMASAGIFSALMIGFGRAVGETMIVTMAAGNTPIMDFNMFSGFRTLSANIAIEMPEAPRDSTHYRALFLGALVLFLMTFFLNTVSEILRQRLRAKNQFV